MCRALPPRVGPSGGRRGARVRGFDVPSLLGVGRTFGSRRLVQPRLGALAGCRACGRARSKGMGGSDAPVGAGRIRRPPAPPLSRPAGPSSPAEGEGVGTRDGSGPDGGVFVPVNLKGGDNWEGVFGVLAPHALPPTTSVLLFRFHNAVPGHTDCQSPPATAAYRALRDATALCLAAVAARSDWDAPVWQTLQGTHSVKRVVTDRPDPQAALEAEGWRRSLATPLASGKGSRLRL